MDLLPTYANEGDDALRLILLCWLLCGLARADGGKVQFQRKAGAFNITVFSAESPIRAGKADLSVMVQNNADQSPVLDATVRLHYVVKEGSTVFGFSAPARHEQATNKLLYAASLDFKNPGKYRLEVSVETKKESALVTGDLDVSPPEPPLLAHWPYFVALPVIALLFAFNQRLKRKRRVVNQP